MNTYSRDVQAAPMRKLQLVEEAVAEGTFFPDETRAGRFKRKAPATPTLEEIEDGSKGTFLIARLYKKLHKREPDMPRGLCGRANTRKGTVDVFVKLPDASLVKTTCGKCFPGQTYASIAAGV